MTDILSGLFFAGFVMAGLVVALGWYAEEGARRRRASLMIAYVVGVTFAGALAQRDPWPFSSWALMVGTAPAEFGDRPNPALIRARAVDSRGTEYPVDYRVWQPLNVEELATWWDRVLPTLPAVERGRAGVYLLARVNEGRAAVRAGRAPGMFHRFLGPLAAPTHTLRRPLWIEPTSVPAEPFVQIRLYREFGTVEARQADPASLRLVRLFEFPADR